MPSLGSIAIGVVTTLIATAILTYVTKRRLFIVVSSLFRHSSLTDQGTIVQLSLINRGFKTEEDIEITLDRQLTYELVASTMSKVSLEGDTLTVPRLSANDQMQFVLMADGGTFSPSSIIGVASRETKGKTVENLEKVPLHAGAMLAVIGMLVGLMGAGALGGYFAREVIDDVRNTEERTSVLEARLEISDQEAARIQSLESQGWRGVEGFLKSGVAEAYPDSLPVSIGEVSRDGDIVDVVVKLENLTEDLIRVSGKLISPAGESDDLDLSEKWFHDHVVLHNASAEVRLKAYLPLQFPQQMVIGDFTIHSRSDIASLEKRIQVPQ
jgi:hypothetical protein